jgi:hypothetical protein
MARDASGSNVTGAVEERAETAPDAAGALGILLANRPS